MSLCFVSHTANQQAFSNLIVYLKYECFFFKKIDAFYYDVFLRFFYLLEGDIFYNLFFSI